MEPGKLLEIEVSPGSVNKVQCQVLSAKGPSCPRYKKYLVIGNNNICGNGIARLLANH